VDDDWLKVFRVPERADPMPYLVLGKGWAPREWLDGGPSRALADPVATFLVRLPGPQTVHLELDAHTLAGSSSLEVWVGEEVAGTYLIGEQPTVFTTPALSLPAGESVVRIRADSVPSNVIFTRIDLMLDK
jgi:hypothetical protein